MRVWRLCDSRHAALDGEGARLAGGQWNSAGQAVVYTSEHLSLAVLETLVHLDPDLWPRGQVKLEIDIPDRVSMETIDAGSLPPGWNRGEAGAELRRMGDEWVDTAKNLVLLVPSAIVPEESNILVNPLHPEFRSIRPLGQAPFEFDPRLVG